MEKSSLLPSLIRFLWVLPLMVVLGCSPVISGEITQMVWSEPAEITLATPEGKASATSWSCDRRVKDGALERVIPRYRMIYLPSSRLIWCGTKSFEHFVAYNDRIIAFFFDSDGMIKFIVSKRKIAGSGEPAPVLVQERDAFTVAAALRHKHGNLEPGYTRMDLLNIYGFEPLARERRGLVPDPPKNCEVSFQGDNLVIVVTSVSDNKAAITLTKDLKVIAASFNKERITLPADIDKITPGVVPWQ